MNESRVYVTGTLTKAKLAAKLDLGLVCTDVIPNGHSGGDVAYFRAGTDEEIADCRRRLALRAPTRTTSAGAETP